MRFYQKKRYIYKQSSFHKDKYGKKVLMYDIISYICTKAENPDHHTPSGSIGTIEKTHRK